MATINVEVPNNKVDNLVALYKARYNVVDKFDTTEQKLEFLGKMLSHETVVIIRQTIVEQAQAQAKTTILADDDIKETPFEAEQSAKVLNVSAEGIK
jgi:hypothetical protein